MNLSIKIMSHDADDTAYLTPLNTATPIKGDHRIGRDSACDIVLPCDEKAVSRHHAEILQRDEQYFFIDRSTNGSYYNNEKNPLPSGELIEISDGDQFHIGHYSLVCTLTPTGETAIVSPTDFGPSANAMVIDSTTSKHTETQDPGEETGSFYEDAFANVTPALSRKDAETVYQNSPITGGLTEAFTPPSSYIPEDWVNVLNPTPESTPPTSTPQTPAPVHSSASPETSNSAPVSEEKTSAEAITQPIQLTGFKSHSGPDHYTALVPTLLASLNLPHKDLTPAQAEAFVQSAGKLLHILLNSVLDLTKTQAELMSTFCGDELSMPESTEPEILKQHSYLSFLETLLRAAPSEQQQLITQLNSQLIRQKDDLNLLSDSFASCMNTVARELSSEQFEKAFQAKEGMMRPDRSPLHRALSQRNVPHRRWSFFREHWDTKIQSVIQSIKTELQTKLLADRNKKQRR